MLTATYSLIALSVEQKNARCTLTALRNFISTSMRDLQSADATRLESAVNRLSQFDQYCHERKVELYVIPAIRKATREADSLLAELDTLSSTSVKILRSMRDGLRQMVENGKGMVDELRTAMELYCSNLYQRLVKEEELFKIAQRVISIDEWFAMAANFLSYDAAHNRRKHAVPATVDPRQSVQIAAA